MSVYQKIRDDNVGYYGTKNADYMRIIIDQYSDRTHFIYEILQNAEDADATKIRFVLYPDRLEIFHNGRPFNQKDIVGVCGIAAGTKKDGTRIGHFGIGFKSVYSYTDTPEIYSNEYHFRIVDYIYPEEIAKRKDVDDGTTCFVLPFNKEDVKREVAFKEIGEALRKKMNAESIIMLNNLQDYQFEIDGDPIITKIEMIRNSLDKGDGNVFSVGLYTTRIDSRSHKKQETDSNYLFFTDAEEEACSIVFRLDNDNRLDEIRNSKIYAFFPTAKEAHQSFLIHAPFDTTPARDNFKEGEEYGKHNIQLISNLCELIQFSLGWLRDNGFLTFDGFSKVLPIYEYEKDDVLYPIYVNTHRYLSSGEPIIPTNIPDKFKKISDICIPSNMEMVSVFNDDDLQTLSGNKRLFWMNKLIQSNAYAELKNYFMRNFSIKTYEWRDLVSKLDASFLEKKKVQWFEELMRNIHSACTKRGPKDSHYINAERIPFVRLQNGKHVMAKDSDGKYQVYINNPDFCQLKIHSDFIQNGVIKGFLSSVLGISLYDVQTQVTDFILPKYKTSKVAFESDNPVKENMADLKVIYEATQRNHSLVELLKEYHIVTDGEGWYQPEELYIPPEGIGDKRLGYGLVEGILNIRFLASFYFDDTNLSVILDRKVFRAIGCAYGLRRVRVTKDKYLSSVNKYCGAEAYTALKNIVFSKNYILDKPDWSSNYEGFPGVFKKMDFKRSQNIARFLNGHISEIDISGDIVGADDKHFDGKHVGTVFGYTMLGVQLCYEKWIYIKSDDKPHSVLEVDRDDLRPEYDASKRLFDMLPFREVKNAMTEWVETTIVDINHQNIVKKLLNNPNELVQIAEAKAKADAKAAAKEKRKKSVKEMMEGADTTQTGEADAALDSDEVYPISEKALSRREEKIQKEFRESLDHMMTVNRRLSFTTKHSNPKERDFLEKEYHGRCQICDGDIIKYDGSPYFEAINIIKFGGLNEKLEETAGLAWNSLCLCPNCAAKYNYSSKLISGMYDQVLNHVIEPGSREPIYIGIMLMGEDVNIKFSPRHLLSMQTVFRMTNDE